MVLGFRAEPKRSSPNQINMEENEQPTYVPQVGFYNSGGLIKKIDYSDLKKVVQIINGN